MRLEWINTCLGARMTDNGQLLDCDGLGVDVAWEVDFPALIQWDLLFHFRGPEDEFRAGGSYAVDAHLMRAPSVIVQELSFDYEPCAPPDWRVSGWDMTEVFHVRGFFTADVPAMYSLDVWFEGEHYANPPYLDVREGMPPGFMG